MNDAIYEDMALEEMVKLQFGVELEVKQMIARNIPTGYTSQASVVLTTKNKLYAVVGANGTLTLGDVRKIILRMGLKAEAYLPPKNRKNYFKDFALEKFKSVYPGRHDITDSDLTFYRLMSPYNPALASIDEITEGVIKQFDTDAASGWRAVIKAHYKQIKTQLD